MKIMASTLFGVRACCTPELPERGAVAKLGKARFAPLRGGLRPGLTELGDSALKISGWDGETALTRTKKLRRAMSLEQELEAGCAGSRPIGQPQTARTR
jgi:hypothetical protein